MGLGHRWRQGRIDCQIKGGAQGATDLTVEHRGILTVGKLIAHQRQAIGDAAGCERFHKLHGDLHRRDTEHRCHGLVVDVIGGKGAQLIEQGQRVADAALGGGSDGCSSGRCQSELFLASDLFEPGRG